MNSIANKHPSFIRNLMGPFLNKYAFIGFILLIAYIGSWPLWISKTDFGFDYETKNFLSDKPIKSYNYFFSFPVKWLESLESKIRPTIRTTPGSAPVFRISWFNNDSLALYAHRFYYPLEWVASKFGYQSIRFFYLTNAENIKKFNSLSYENKCKQFNQLGEYHGKLLFLRNDSYNFIPQPNYDVDPSFFEKYEYTSIKSFINCNSLIRSQCYGGYDDFCYSQSAYNKMMQEALIFVGWYNHYSLTNPSIKMIESKRYRE